MKTSLIPIPADNIPRMVGKIVHVSGWPNGCQFRLDSVNADTAHLTTPKTGRKYTVNISQLCYSRKHEPMEDRQ